MGSAGAKALAQRLSDRLGHTVFRVREGYNKPNRIIFKLRDGTDKFTQLQRFQENAIPCPEFTRDRNVATGWSRDGSGVVCRLLLRGSEGRGIVVAEGPDQVVDAPLYTKYRKKKKEFRVHVFNGQVIDVQEKRKRRDFADQRDSRIRNTSNGYVFCRDGVVEPTGLRETAMAAAASLRYQLGAVDIGFNEHDNQCFVFEVNSTPGMEGTTLDKYATAIEGWYRSQV
jgi:glutathione synthase/RimK-type ligase-like ATP-grasp enzyme